MSCDGRSAVGREVYDAVEGCGAEELAVAIGCTRRDRRELERRDAVKAKLVERMAETEQAGRKASAEVDAKKEEVIRLKYDIDMKLDHINFLNEVQYNGK